MTIEAKWSDFSSLDAERMLVAGSQLLPRWITMALVVAIAWQLARIIWMLMPGSSTGDLIIAPPVQISRAGNAGTAAAENEVAIGVFLSQ